MFRCLDLPTISLTIRHQNTAGAELNNILKDARRFVLSHRAILEIAPLQVYASALIFSPTDSLVRNMFNKEEPNWLTLKPRMKRNWDTCIQTLENRSGRVRSVAISRDGQRLASVTNTGVEIWNVASSHCIRSLEFDSELRAVTFSVDGQHLVTGLQSGDIGLWNVDSGVHMQLFSGHEAGIRDIALSPDGRLLASASTDGNVKMWDFTKGECIRTMHGHEKDVTSLSFSADGRQLASGGRDCPVIVWETATGMCIWILNGHRIAVRSVTFLSGDSLASGSSEGTVKIWDVTTGICIRTLPGHGIGISSIIFLGNGLSLASASGDGTIQIWDDEGACVQTLQHGEYGDYGDPEGPMLAFSASKQLLTSAWSDTTKIWDMAARSTARPVEDHVDEVIFITISPGGKWLGSAFADGTVKIWDTFNGTCVNTFQNCHGEYPLTFSPDSRFLLFVEMSGSKGSRTARVLNIAEGYCTGTFEDMFCHAFSPDSKRLALNTHSSVLIWDIDAQTCTQEISISTTFIIFSPDSNHLASISGTNVELRDILTGHCLRTFTSDLEIISITMSRDPQWIAAWTGDDILVWNIHTGTLLRTLHADMPMILRSPTFSSNGRWIAMCGQSCIVVWDMNAFPVTRSTLTNHWIYNVQFDATHDSQLSTKSGVLDVDKFPVTNIEQINTTSERYYGAGELNYYGYGLSSDGRWILRGSERVIWLPSEYRSEKSMALASTVGIISSTGALLIMKFDMPSLDSV